MSISIKHSSKFKFVYITSFGSSLLRYILIDLNKNCWLRKGNNIGREVPYLYFPQSFCSPTIITNRVKTHQNLENCFVPPYILIHLFLLRCCRSHVTTSSYLVHVLQIVTPHEYILSFQQLLKWDSGQQTFFFVQENGDDWKNILEFYHVHLKHNSRYSRKYALQV